MARKHAAGADITNGEGIQRYALDSAGNVVDVREIQDADDAFSCPACHDAMIPKKGKIRTWHFAHKTNTCSYESYLHALAKIHIAEWFKKSESIILDMGLKEEVCANYNNCPLYDSTECMHLSSYEIKYNLKTFYPDCEIESSCNGFIADILCPHPKSPLFIEIFVNHECSEEKKLSGNHIIEFVIDSENSINDIISSSIIKESENIRLYNFKKDNVSISNDIFQRKLVRCILYASGKARIAEDYTNCHNGICHNKDSMYEIIAAARHDPKLIYNICKAMAHRDGCLQRCCNICRLLGEQIKYKTFCRDYDSKKCNLIKDKEFLELFNKCIAKWLGSYKVWSSKYGWM